MYKKYSVLMSVYKKEKPEYLKQAIDSMLKQTVLTDDFVLVCDGPLTKELDKLIGDYTIKYPSLFHIIRIPANKGLGNALSIGICQCQNNLIARMDSDDISLPHRCQQQLDAFNRNFKLHIVSGSVAEFSDYSGKTTSIKRLPMNSEEIKSYAKFRCPFNHPCVMYKKEAVIKAGNYQSDSMLEDYDLWVRMLMNGCNGFNISEILLNMRAGKKMYSRRGSLKYLKGMTRFRLHMRRIHFITTFEFVYSWIFHAIICILPTDLRLYIYGLLLREKA